MLSIRAILPIVHIFHQNSSKAFSALSMKCFVMREGKRHVAKVTEVAVGLVLMMVLDVVIG